MAEELYHSIEYPVLNGQGHCLRAAGYAEFGEYAAYMKLDRRATYY